MAAGRVLISTRSCRPSVGAARWGPPRRYGTGRRAATHRCNAGQRVGKVVIEMTSLNLDDLVPDPDIASHSELVIRADPGAVWAELISIKMDALPLTRILEIVRYIPRRVARRGGWASADQTYLEHLPIPVVSLVPASSQISAGLSRAWKLLSPLPKPDIDARDLPRWKEPGWIKVAMEFRLEAVSDGTLLTSETRIAATDPRTRRAFARYWHLISWFSTYIRHEVMTKISRRVTS